MKRPMKHRGVLFFQLFGLILILGLYGLYSLSRSGMAARWLIRWELGQFDQYPFLSLTPVDRTIETISPTSSQQFTAEGFTFRVPWSGMPTESSRQGVGTDLDFSRRD